MSRSYKKGYVGVASHSNSTMKDWKRMCNRKIRRISMDDPDEWGYEKSYKKINDRWLSPEEGKNYWDSPKARRK
jgi:predicted alpha/beta hydrolase